jgi:hypothetical protein
MPAATEVEQIAIASLQPWSGNARKGIVSGTGLEVTGQGG